MDKSVNEVFFSYDHIISCQNYHGVILLNVMLSELFLRLKTSMGDEKLSNAMRIRASFLSVVKIVFVSYRFESLFTRSKGKYWQQNYIMLNFYRKLTVFTTVFA